MPKSSFYTPAQLRRLGLKAFGRDVLISSHARLYSPHRMSLGNSVRIDDFCLLSGEIELGNHIHISAYSALYARMGVRMEDYSGLSPRTTVLSASDDFSGEFMVGPMVPVHLTRVAGSRVTIGKFAQIGAGAVIFPGVTVGEGAVVGAMSLVNRDLEPWTVYAGVPARSIKPRLKNIVALSRDIPHHP